MPSPNPRKVTFNLEPNPNHQHPPPIYTRPLLILTSHSHSPPLHPPPDLTFDVRSLPNPPKNVRDAHDGTSPHLREFLIKGNVSWAGTGVGFVERMYAIKDAILVRMQEVEDEVVLEGDEGNEDVGVGAGKEAKEGQGDNDVPVLNRGRERKGGDGEEEEVEEEESGMILRVGIFCEMGRHRSVAMVEELSRLRCWIGWDVEVLHRDVEKKKRGSGKKERRKHGRGMVVGGRVPE